MCWFHEHGTPHATAFLLAIIYKLANDNFKPGPHQQQCRSNIVECYNVECCFDIVAVFGNNVEATFDIVAKNGNNVERVLRWNFVLCLLLRQCCFDIVVSVDRALRYVKCHTVRKTEPWPELRPALLYGRGAEWPTERGTTEPLT